MNTKPSSNRHGDEMKKEKFERQKAFLLKEIDDINRILESLNGASYSLRSLRMEMAYRKARLEILDDLENNELSSFTFFSLRKELDEIRERAELLATKRRLLPIVPGAVWTTKIILSIVAIYIFCIGFVQSIKRPQILTNAVQTVEIQTASAFSNQNIQTVVPGATDLSSTPDPDNVTVSFSNQNNNRASVHLIIMQDDVELLSLIIPQGGIAPIKNLPPGSYQVMARPIYEPITPQSANCDIQWQLAELYSRNLVIPSGEAVIQIQRFDSEPQQMCFTETSSASTPTQ